MWWGKGEFENVLYGQLKVLVTRGYINYGVVSVVGDKIAFYLENKIKIGIVILYFHFHILLTTTKYSIDVHNIVPTTDIP